MSKRLAFLAAASPLALIALPAQAQVDDRYEGVEEVIETYSEPVVQDIGAWEADAGASYAHGDYAEPEAGDWRGERYERRQEQRGHRPHHRGHAAPAAGQPRQLAYSPAERAEWLSQCRSLHVSYDEPVYYEDERDGNGDIIGGLLGAVAGGVAGNRIAGRNDRLAGTLIGAGVGGLAGAVIGSVIESIAGDDDDDDYRDVAALQEPGFDYCEAYLLNYERGYGTPGQMAYAPVMMVPVAQGRALQSHGARRVIVEEVEIDEAPRHHRARRVIHRQPQGDKRTPIR